MCYAVLAVVSNCCPPLKGRFLTRYSPVRHCPLLHLDESSIHRFSFDLHVLSTPPAFVLSQDQTLYKWYLNDLSRSNLYRAICHSFKNFLYLASPVIDLTRFRQVLSCASFDALPSGAFRFVRCLIYKVHALAFVNLSTTAEQSLLYHMSAILSTTFFIFFDVFRRLDLDRIAVRLADS